MPNPLRVVPWDVHNGALVEAVHPPGWKNPEPASRYHLVVVGAGTAGLVTAAGAAALGAKVALVEKHLLGGDCLNYGCVPSKALIRASRAAADVRDAGAFGVRVPEGVRVDFGAVMERMRRLRAGIAPHDSAARFRDLGVDVFLGNARFTGPQVIEVEGSRLSFRKACIATGARAAAPPIPGIAEVGYLTNETIFSLTELPRRLAVIGAGPIGCEMAQAFRRFGSDVSLLDAAPQILIREDRDAAERLQQAFGREGVRLVLGTKIRSATVQGTERVIALEQNGRSEALVVDQILVGVGRAPNVEGLGLEAAGVAYDPRAGVKVDDRLRTTNRRVFAAGDVCFPYKFTHTADALARIVIRNALFLGRARASALTIPWCTYTDPEIAHVGLSEREAKEKRIPIRVFIQEMRDVDRAVLDGEAEGFVKILAAEGTDRILGATIVARHAGEMISEITLAMTGGVGLRKISETIHPYPTQAETIKKVGDAWSRSRLTPRAKKWIGRWLAWLK